MFNNISNIMALFRFNTKLQIKLIIGDWSGTFIDPYSNAPGYAMKNAFAKHNINMDLSTAKLPIGLPKKEHISFLLKIHDDTWYYNHKRKYNDIDILNIMRDYEAEQLRIIDNHCELLPDVKEVITELQQNNIKVGSTTGFPRVILDKIIKNTQQQGLYLDAYVSSDDVSHGRPNPHGIYKNCELLNITNMKEVLKIGDSIYDIQEGLNAKTWTTGIAKYAVQGEYDTKLAFAILEEEGSHYVIDTIKELNYVIKDVNMFLEKH